MLGSTTKNTRYNDGNGNLLNQRCNILTCKSGCARKDINTTSYHYDGNNRLALSVRKEAQATHHTSYAYDANGNQLKEQKEILKPAGMGEAILELSPTLDMIRLYEYNGFDQLVSAYTKRQQVTYTYNPNGLRQSKTVEGKRTTHIWDGQNMVAELGSEGTATANYIRGIGLLQNKGSGTVNYLFNGRGDVVQLTDTDGNVVRSYDYDAFGNPRTVGGNPETADTNPFRFCAEYLDEESDHIYLRARYYDPVIGRFMSEDKARDGWK